MIVGQCVVQNETLHTHIHTNKPTYANTSRSKVHTNNIQVITSGAEGGGAGKHVVWGKVKGVSNMISLSYIKEYEC